MKLPLRYFLLACLLLGAVAIPVGWRRYRDWKANEVAAAKVSLAKARMRHLELVADAFDRSGVNLVLGKLPPATAESTRWQTRIRALEDRLEQLTGIRPNQREWLMRQTKEDLEGVVYIEGLDIFKFNGSKKMVARRKLAIRRASEWGLLPLGQPAGPVQPTPKWGTNLVNELFERKKEE